MYFITSQYIMLKYYVKFQLNNLLKTYAKIFRQLKTNGKNSINNNKLECSNLGLRTQVCIISYIGRQEDYKLKPACSTE